MNSFNQDNPKYRCCCQSLHVRSGSVLIALAHFAIYCFIFWHCVEVACSVFGQEQHGPIRTATRPTVQIQQTSTDGTIQFFRTESPENENMDTQNGADSEIVDILMNGENLTGFDETEHGELSPQSSLNASDKGNWSVITWPLYKAHIRDVLPSLSTSVLLLASAVGALCSFWALCKTEPIFLVPEIILIVANLMASLLMIIFCITALVMDSSELNAFIKRQLLMDPNLRQLPETTRFLARLAAGFGIAVFVGAVVIELAFLRVLKMCYGYLKDKKAFLDDHPAGVRYFAIDEHDPEGDETSAVAIMDTARSELKDIDDDNAQV